MPKKKGGRSPQQLWEQMLLSLVHFVERLFFSLGVIVAHHPWRTILLTWTFVFVSCVGFMRFHIEKNPLKLWVPPESDFFHDTHWYIDQFSTGFRYQKLIITADNVLTPKVFMSLSNISEEVENIQVSYKGENYTIRDLCFKVPVVNFFSNSNRKIRSVEPVNSSQSTEKTTDSDSDYSDPSLWFDTSFYCEFIDSFPLVCLQYSVLDLFNSDSDLLKSITKYDIIKKLRETKVNPTTGHPVDYSKLLGGIKYDSNGDIVSANAVLTTWYSGVNMSAADLDEVGNLVGTEDWVSIPLALWEKEYIDLMGSISKNTSEQIYYEAGRSFGDISGEAMFHDVDKLFIGIILMFFYIQFALSRCNWLEIKLTLGSIGLMCVGMAYITAVGWCSAMGISFGPVHSSLPFLLMGLGVDDMFVMKACWENLSDSESKKSLPLKIGYMLKHAGVSIVITSFTDIVALLIGAITILPSLRSFCFYAAAGVFFIFCYSVTFFVAIFTLDIMRIEDNRNGFLFCYKHKKKIIISDDKTVFQKLFCKFYEKIVFTLPAKAIIIIFTIIMTGFSIEAILKLEQRFDPKWFIPEGTYYKQFLNIHEYYFPEEGNAAMVFMGEMDYREDFRNLYNMIHTLQNQSYVTDLVTWADSFQKYVLKNHDRNLLDNSTTLSDVDFRTYLSSFLHSSVGGKFQVNFKFTDPLTCGQPVSNITASYFTFKFSRFQGPVEYIPAMNNVKSIVKTANFSTGDGYRSVWSKVFANWVTDEVISVEVERNIELALLCVMLCTAVLITNLQMCFWIFMCVLLTIVYVLGWMQRWGMTVDIVCCIGLELAIGLCVDYAAHVGHTFLTLSEGTRTERALKTVSSIGNAVMLGGGSTLLSLSLLSASKAYTFQSFFKIFLLVIVFGVFNGLVFLPVLLSLIGPNPYKSDEKELTPEAVELNGKEHSMKPIDVS